MEACPPLSGKGEEASGDSVETSCDSERYLVEDASERAPRAGRGRNVVVLSIPSASIPISLSSEDWLHFRCGTSSRMRKALFRRSAWVEGSPLPDPSPIEVTGAVERTTTIVVYTTLPLHFL
ncbi:hypothetical protein GUJ93_ZPchr0001g30671 [Zizania palustris]|uniref:Uncharacterized protein n=1 Tax=Zizania palustris TaxID=103762 RepID=A0A8J5RQT5_ZIZPA|nr:hypothetical protein GUJ93_ZPchr0001g30671 [Zizania palustris]